MLKAIGIITLIVVCSLVGIKLSENVKLRHKRLGQLSRFIEEIADHIRTGTALFDILNTDKARELIEVDGLNMRVRQEGLNTKDKTLLDEFFSCLGMGDTKTEINRCEVYLELIKKQEKDAEAEAKSKAGLYSKLGFFAGLFIAVVLI